MWLKENGGKKSELPKKKQMNQMRDGTVGETKETLKIKTKRRK